MNVFAFPFFSFSLFSFLSVFFSFFFFFFFSLPFIVLPELYAKETRACARVCIYRFAKIIDTKLLSNAFEYYE